MLTTKLRLPALLFISIIAGPFTMLAQKRTESQQAAPFVQTMQSPLLGFVYSDVSRELRAISGIPGASVLSEPVPLPSEDVTNLHFAPGEQYALVQTADFVGVLNLSVADFGSFGKIDGALLHPELVTFSPSGTAALLYSASELRMQVVAGLPSAPALTHDVDLSRLSDTPAAWAVADDSQTSIVAMTNGNIYRLSISAATSLEFVDHIEHVAAITFKTGSTDALAVSHDGQVAALSNLRGLPSHSIVTEGLTGFEGDVRLVVDRGTAIVASANKIFRIDLQTLQVYDSTISTISTALQLLRSPRRFLVSYAPGAPAWIVDASGRDLDMFFVPALPLLEQQCIETCISESRSNIQ